MLAAEIAAGFEKLAGDHKGTRLRGEPCRDYQAFANRPVAGG